MSCFAASSRPAESGPSNLLQPGKGIAPSRTGKKSAYVSPSEDGKPPIRATLLILPGRASAAGHARPQAAECPTTMGVPAAAPTPAATPAAGTPSDAARAPP